MFITNKVIQPKLRQSRMVRGQVGGYNIYTGPTPWAVLYFFSFVLVSEQTDGGSLPQTVPVQVVVARVFRRGITIAMEEEWAAKQPEDRRTLGNILCDGRSELIC